MTERAGPAAEATAEQPGPDQDGEKRGPGDDDTAEPSPGGDQRRRSPGPDSPEGESGEPRGSRRPLVAEALLALEIAALAAFAFSRPVLDSFGRSPETFVVRGADARTVVAFGVVVAVVPALALALLGLASRALGPRVRGVVHLALVVAVGGVAVWRLGQDVTGWPGEAKKLLLAGVVGGLLLGAARWRLPSSRTFLRFAGAASAVFLFQFLVLSPASDLVFGDGPTVDAEVAAQVSAAVGDEPPDIVVLVFDALPTESLLDGSGHIDAELYPNFAALAETSTWYRNNTAVSAFTAEAVPALLTGRYPDPAARSGFAPPDPENLFTLLGGTYDLHVHEQLTQLCPEEMCPRDDQGGLPRLLGDATALWAKGTTVDAQQGFSMPAILGDDRYDNAHSWIERQDFGDPRPGLYFYHAVLPHDPWRYTDDGTLYESPHLPTGFFATGWTESGIDVGRQRYQLQLQASDRLLGEVLDGLRSAGTFDDTLVLVTADHGQSFLPNEPWRALSAENAHQIAWTPLLVKEPGQQEGTTSDDDVRAIDVVPTIADLLDLELPWDVDGVPASEAGGADDRGGPTKAFDDNDLNSLRAEDGAVRAEVDAREGFEQVLATDQVEGEGPDGVWKRTAHGDLFGRALADLDVGDPGEGEVTVESPGDLGSIDVDEPLPLEVVGHTDLPEGAVVAYALNGTVGAVTEVEVGIRDGYRLAHGFLPPDVFVDGDNELTAYLVEGEPGAETLHPIQVRSDG